MNPHRTISWQAVVAVHRDDSVLQETLLRSQSLREHGRLTIQRGFESVARAYNEAILKSDADVILFLHADVYLPPTWESGFERTLLELYSLDPNWGVAGLFGTSRDGAPHGFTYTTGRGGFVGKPFEKPTQVRTVDEFVFAIRRNGGLRCDEALPSPQFQLGATDLCLSAEAIGMRNYVVPCFALHNSNGWSSLPLRFWRPYLFVRSRWRNHLPIYLPYSTITRDCFPMIKNSIRHTVLGVRGSYRKPTRVPNPAELYAQIQRGLAALF